MTPQKLLKKIIPWICFLFGTQLIADTLQQMTHFNSQFIYAEKVEFVANQNNIISMTSPWGHFKVFDITTGETLVSTYLGKMVLGFDYSHSLGLIASSTYNEGIILREVSTGTIHKRFRTYASDVRALAFSPDNKYIAAYHLDSGVYLYDMEVPTRELLVPSKRIKELHWSRDGKFLLAVSFASQIHIISVEKKEIIKVLNLQEVNGEPFNVSKIAFSPDFGFLAAYGYLWDQKKHMAFVADLETLEVIHTPYVSNSRFTSIQFDQSMSNLILTDELGGIKVLDLLQDKVIFETDAFTDSDDKRICSSALSLDGKVLAIAGKKSEGVLFYKLAPR